MLLRFVDAKSLQIWRSKRSKLIVSFSLFLFLFIYDPRNLIYGSLWRQTKEALTDPYLLTIHCNEGRLGNQMGTYATLYGLARLNQRIPYGQRCNMDSLLPYFELSMAEIGDLPKKYAREYEIGPYLRPRDRNIPSHKNLLTGYLYPSSFTFYHHVRNEIKREFRFKKRIRQYVRRVLGKMAASVYVGVHVRRTDYCSWLKAFRGKEFDREYILKAMRYFKKRYDRPLFLVVSDDREWCRRQFGGLADVVVTEEPPEPAYDLALLASCHHSIITYGTFGFWAAYLAGGHTVYYADFLAPDSKFLRSESPYNQTYLPQWVGISTEESDFWIKRNSTFHPKECPDLSWWRRLFGLTN